MINSPEKNDFMPEFISFLIVCSSVFLRAGAKLENRAAGINQCCFVAGEVVKMLLRD